MIEVRKRPRYLRGRGESVRTRAMMAHYHFDASPLIELAIDRHKTYGSEPLGLTDVGRVVRVLGVSHTSVDHWIERGVRWDTADKMACRLGLHPGSIWPEWWEHA